MPRRKHKSPTDPATILAQRNTRRRRREQLVAATPELWGPLPELKDLETSRNVVVDHGRGGGLVKARRLDAFDTLKRAGGLTAWQHQAAQRLLKDLAEYRGVGAAADRIKGLATGPGRRHAGNMDMMTVAMVAAGERLYGSRTRLGVLEQIGPADRALLLGLMEPIVWRDQVRQVTGETEVHAQAARVRAALENLRLAYGLGPEPQPLHPFDSGPELAAAS